MRADFPQGPRAREGAPRDPSRRLLAELHALTQARGTLLRHLQRPWASITFSGMRHELAFVFEGNEATAAGEAFIAALPDHEFAIRGQIVADAAVKAVEHVMLPEPRLTVELELLLLEDH